MKRKTLSVMTIILFFAIWLPGNFALGEKKNEKESRTEMIIFLQQEVNNLLKKQIKIIKELVNLAQKNKTNGEIKKFQDLINLEIDINQDIREKLRKSVNKDFQKMNAQELQKEIKLLINYGVEISQHNGLIEWFLSCTKNIIVKSKGNAAKMAAFFIPSYLDNYLVVLHLDITS